MNNQNPTNGTQAATAPPAFGFDEAPASFNVKAYSPGGYDVMLTLRSDNTKELLDRANAALVWLDAHGFSPTRQPLQQPASQPQQHPADPTPAQREAELRGMVPPVVASQQQQASRPVGTESFQAEKLVGTVTEGKLYWKVRGERFSKHGVTIWPEVLAAAGFFIDDLNIMDQYDLSGYTAFYELKEGKPTKVTQLVKNHN